jgi:tetratricopeptide (TPR) repeat protein
MTLPSALLQLKKEAGRQRQNPDLWSRLALGYAAAGQFGEAREAWSHVTRLQPDNALAWFGLANQCHALGDYPLALDHYFKALTLNPQAWDVRNNLAVLLKLLGERALAEKLLLEALELNPDYLEAIVNLGNLYRDLNELDKARLCLQHALALAPDNAELLTNWGLLEKAAGRHGDALASYRRALDLPGRPVELPFNYAIALIQAGDYQQGFAWYEQRWDLPELARKRAPLDAAMPAWQGEYLAGKTLLLWNEQGLGDMIQMARFLPEWRACHPDCRIVLRVDRSLVRLLSPLVGADLLFGTDEPLPAADFHLSAMSLPFRSRLRPDAVPARDGYLHVDAAAAAAAAARLPLRRGRPRIGVVWQSGQPGVGRDALDRAGRSLAPETLAALLDLCDADWVSLQVGGDALPDALAQRLHVPGALRDFADTAALLANLDALVSVDTAAAHLGGALGMPTYVLMSTQGGNLFPVEGEAMPWYDSMRLVRQQSPHDWQAALAMLGDHLARLPVDH